MQDMNDQLAGSKIGPGFQRPAGLVPPDATTLPMPLKNLMMPEDDGVRPRPNETPVHDADRKLHARRDLRGLLPY
jgi:hypothetical protein